MNAAEKIDLAIMEGVERGFRAAAARAATRADEASDGGLAALERRNAVTWASCADDVAAMMPGGAVEQREVA